MKDAKLDKVEPEGSADVELDIDIERVDLNPSPTDKHKTLGCWGPSPDDNRNQC